METVLARLTEIAKRNPNTRFTSLAHYLNEDFLKACYEELKTNRAAGIDRVTVEEYGKNLNANIRDLVEKMKRWAYRPQPVRRAYIPKSDGSRRGLGVPATEDRVVQRAISKILMAVYEGLFLETSWGFRPKRSAHQALNRVDKAIMTQPVQWVVDMDIEKFYDTIDHHKLMECLRQRIADGSLLRLIARFLKAGVMEEGNYLETDRGAPQGGNLSPVLSNIFLHYALDLWFERKIKPTLKGYARLTRFADDFIVVFQHEQEAKAFGLALRERLGTFGLKIKESKSTIVEFGREAWRKAKGNGKKPDTFDFLGFTHFCSTTRRGFFKVDRKTSAKKFSQKCKALNVWIKAVRSQVPLKEWWPILRVKLTGHYRYYGISGNMRKLRNYYWQSIMLAYKWVNRRSQKRSYNWESFSKFLKWNPLPQPRIYHDLYAFA
ncbi:MAG: group II intron reverse transcriptase/maturase [Elusimicrobia bacterium]|nr:group II intron reverse transcriptase/maturase [Elusimicrobiota bacterium]